jgi:hypothetical protein
MSKFKTEWIDHKREPQCEPNPDYPNGIDADISSGAAVTCTTDLPYPARRCGLYIIECETCGRRIGITTAGRPDDQRTVKLACKKRETIQ